MKRSQHGTPLLERVMRMTEVHEGACWEWRGFRNGRGYGAIDITSEGRKRPHQAHRVMYELLRGPIPEGLVLDHLCRNRGCVNPDHLEPVTQRENNLRGVGASGRNARKTHCSQGHPYDGENLRVRGDGHRVCRTCDLARKHAKTTHIANKNKTHCANGHLLDEANTYRRRDRPQRACRICHRESVAAGKQRRLAHRAQLTQAAA